MKKFCIKIVIFLLPFILVTLFFEIYLRGINTNYKEKMAGLQAKNKSIELLVLGNSHANYGIDPTKFDLETYNMAMVNQPLYHDYKITEKVIDSLKNLKAVVICIDYHTLYFSDQGLRNNWIYYDYDIDTNVKFINKFSRFWNGYTPKVSFSMLKYDVKRRIFSYKNKIPTLNYHVEEGVVITDTIKNGWLGYTGSNSKKFTHQAALNRANTFNKLIEDEEEKRNNLLLLNDFLDLLNKRGIKSFVITMPSSSVFNANVREDVRKKDILLVNETLKKHNVNYYDFFHSLKEEEYYYDSDHLNKKGAHLFSSILNDSINKNLKMN